MAKGGKKRRRADPVEAEPRDSDLESQASPTQLQVPAARPAPAGARSRRHKPPAPTACTAQQEEEGGARATLFAKRARSTGGRVSTFFAPEAKGRSGRTLADFPIHTGEERLLDMAAGLPERHAAEKAARAAQLEERFGLWYLQWR